MVNNRASRRRNGRARMLARRMRRAAVIVTVLATLQLVAVPPAFAGTLKPATVSWSGLWDWLTGQRPSLHLPAQQGGTARGLPHSVPVSATRAGRGTGRRPGKGRGELPSFRRHTLTAKRTVTGKAIGNGAHSFNPRTSVPVMSKSTSTSTLYRNSDGTFTRIVSTQPVNFRAGGSWHRIDTLLAPGSGGRLHESANSMAVSLSRTAASRDLVTVGIGPGESASYGLAGAARAAPRVSGSAATYPSVLPATDLVLAAVGSGLKESLVLHSAAAPSSWVFPLNLAGLSARLASDGSVNLVNGAGAVVARIPHAFMHDSSFNRKSGLPAQSSAVSYRLITVHSQPAIRMTASRAWLDSPARVYPVTIDPSFQASGTTYVDSAFPNEDYSSFNDMLVGTWNNGGEIGNAFLAFSGLGSALAGQHITAASLHLFNYWSATCSAVPFSVSPITQSWPVTGAKSYPGPSIGSSIGSASIAPAAAACPPNTNGNTAVGSWMAVNLSTGTFNSWTTGGADNGLAVTAATTGNTSWKRFDSDNTSNPPYLQLTYTPDVPPQIDSQYPLNNYNSPTLTPELVATGHDPDNWPKPIQYNFTVYSTSGATIASSGNISASHWDIPAGKLSWGQTYYWSVQAYDGFDFSTAVNAHYFTTQVPQPLITSGLAQNAGGHGFDPSIGNYTTSDTDANVQTAGPSLSVQRDYNSLDPRISGAFGAGWSTLYDMKATEVTDASGAVTSVEITYPDGSEVGFGDNNGVFTPPSGRFATLTALPNHAGYTLTDKQDTTYTFKQVTSSANVFALSSISDYEGRTETFSYSGGQLTTVSSGVSGRSLHFTWTTPSGAQFAHVATVSTDPATSGQPSTALTWTYSYSGDSLTSVCPPTSTTACTTYSYTTGSHFSTAVLDSGPTAYWRMGEASGTAAADAVLANEGVYNASYSNVALGQLGPLPGSTATAASFNGSSSYVQLPPSLASNASVFGGTNLTVALWFKTTSANGVLLSSQADPLSGGTTQGGYTPSLYVGADGKLEGEFWLGTVAPISSAQPVNDGKWHFAVLTAAGDTQSLYLDGALVGTKSGQVGGISQPNMYVGAGYLGGVWPNEVNQNKNGNTGYATYFNGSVSDVAVYGRYLTAPSVAQLYTTGHSAASLLHQITTPNGNVQAQISYNPVTDRVTSVTDENGGTWGIGAPTVAGSSQVYRSAVLGAAPADYWRLGDTGNATQAADEVKGGTALYNSVTLGASGPFSDITAASFNGTSSFVQLPSADSPGTGPASIGVWFKVPQGNTAGGVLYDYETYPLNQPGMPTGQWVPALYVGTDGKLRGEFWNGGTSTITSTGAVNDGNWHYAVLAASPSGQSLYLDGSLVGSSSTPLQPSAGNNVYIGAGESANWPSHPSNTLGYFTGTIAEAAYYRQALSADQVRAQWLAAKSASGLAPTETVHVTDPGGNTLSYSYDPLQGNRIIAQTDALGNRTTYGYDTSGFLHTTTNPAGDVVITGHDVRGNMVSQTTCQDQAANKCSTQYYSYYPDDTSTTLTPDPRNDLILTMRDGRSASATDNRYLTSYTYDAAGNQTSAATPPVPGFPNGRTTTMTYTTSSTPAVGGGNAPPGLLASVITPGGAKETISYYSNGDPASVTDPAGEVTAYTYDALGRVLTKKVTSDSYPQGLTTSYAYDGQNRLLTQTDPPVTDHVTGAIHTPQTTNAYDGDGNLTSVTVSDATGGDASRTTTFNYNSHDQMASKTDALGNTTTFAYDAYGHQISQTDAAGNTTRYSYDPNGHLLTVTLAGYTGDPANPAAPADLVEQSRAYDPDGRLATLTDSMGRQTRYTYTDNGLVATLTRTDPATGQSYVEQSNFYDAAGNLIKRVTGNGATTTTYTVDAANRILSATLDPGGLNRTTTTSYSPDDFVVNTSVSDGHGQVSAVDYTRDPLGRVTSRTVHDDSPGHPVGWWPLTSGAGTPTYAGDSSGSGNTAILSGGVALSATGAAFTGNGAITTAGPVVNTAASFTVSAWVKLNTASSNYQDLVTQDGVNASGFMLYVTNTNQWAFGRPHADVVNRTTADVDSNQAAQVGAWTHLVGVYDSSASTISLYVNGALQGTASTGSAPWAANGSTVIGRELFNGAPASYFTSGQISDVQLYQRALSSSDVASLFSGGQAGPALETKPLTTSWTLDQRGLPTSMTDPNGNTTSYLYDEVGKLAQVTGPAVSTEVNGGTPVTSHPVTSYGYDTFGETVSAEDPNGNITTTNYDADGRAVSQVSAPYTPPGSSAAITAVTTRTYDKIGELASVTDPLGNSTSYTYDQLGDVATVTQPGGGVTHYTYDTNGERLSTTDPLGAQTQATYDYLGRQLTATQIVRQPSLASFTATNAYDPAGNLASTTSPAGVKTSYAYDAAGEVTSVTDGAGNTTSYSYDGAGRRIAVTLPDGTSQHVTYDEAGRAVGTVSEDASGGVLRQTSAGYDANGDLISATDAMGNTSTLSYNALGLPVQEVQPVSASSSITTSFGYDAAGHLTRYTNGNGNPTIYTYNSWNLPESTIVPATTAYPSLTDRTFTTSYNAGGQAVTKTAPGGVTLNASYDALGNLTSQSGSGADAPTTTRTFTYNAASELTSASAAGGTNTFTYDDRGLLLSAAGPSGSSSFTYNADGQMASQTTAAGTSNYTYDGAGRLATLADAATGATLSYGYNSLSLPTSISYGSGAVSRAFTYNGLHQLTGDTLTSPSGQTEASIAYGYNANGDETSKATTGFAGSATNTYTYDQANRLTSWNNGTTTINYGYDANGNRTQAGPDTFSYDARDELVSGAGASYTYTPRGTLASVTGADGTVTTTTADAFNQVITQGTKQYAYDALGRVATTGGQTFSYVGPTNNLASDGTYTYSRDPGGDLIGMASGGTATLAFTDQHLDVVGTFTATGTALAGSTTYNPFGAVISHAGSTGNLGFQSGWTDPTTGNVNAASRWYNPATGQFLSRDAASNSPIPNSIAANTFAYGDDNPLTTYDLLGTCGFFDCIGSFVSSVATGISNVASAAYNDINQGWSDLSQGFQNAYNWASSGLAWAATQTVHAATTLAHQVQDVWNTGTAWATNTVSYAYNGLVNSPIYHVVVNAAKVAYQAARSNPVVAATYHAVKYTVNAATQFVQHHAAAIASFAASSLVFMGCEAVVTAGTAGTLSLPGAVGCGALAGAVGNMVNYAMSTPTSKWSVGGFLVQGVTGAAAGAAGGLLGPLGGKLLGAGAKLVGALGSKLLAPVVDAIGSRLGAALTNDAANAAVDTAATNTADTAITDTADQAASGLGDSAGSTGADPATSDPTTASGDSTAGPSDPSAPASNQPETSGGGQAASSSSGPAAASAPGSSGGVALDSGTARALSSADRSVANRLIPQIGGRQMVMSQTAVDEFQNAVARLAGPTEKGLADDLMSQVQVVADNPSQRALGLQLTRSVGANDIQIFGTADQMGIDIFTSDAKFLRGAAAQGVQFNAILHAPMSFLGN